MALYDPATGKEIPIPAISRRVNRESLDGISSNSNSSRIKAIKVQSNPPERRDDGSSRTRAPETGSVEGDRELQVSSAEGNSNPFTSPNDVLKIISERWKAVREAGKVGAFRRLQSDLMDASPFLVPGIIPYKDLIAIVTDLEKEIKGSTDKPGRSNEELLSNFLSGGDAIPIPEGLDKRARIEKGDEEPVSTTIAPSAT